MIDAADVTAVFVTKGNMPHLMRQILEATPYPSVVWNNQERPFNLAVLGRYAAIAEVKSPVVFNCDDDCYVKDWAHEMLRERYEPGRIVGFEPHTHSIDETTGLQDPDILVGWGAIYDKELPDIAFSRWLGGGGSVEALPLYSDLIFCTMTPWTRIDIGTDLEWHQNQAHAPVVHPPNAFTPDRMHHQEHHLRRPELRSQALSIIRSFHNDPSWRGDTA